MNAHREPHVVAGERVRSHAEIHGRARRAAAGFRGLGIGEGDAVALLLRNDITFFEAALASPLAGAYPVPINWQMAAEDIGHILRDSAAGLLVVHADLLQSVADVVPKGLPIVVVATPPEGRIAFDLPDAAPPEGPDVWDAFVDRHDEITAPADGDRPAVIYTSGTTGRPKGVRRSAQPRSKGSSRALAVYGLADEGNRKTVLINGPLHHSVPNAYARLALRAGADIVLEARFAPEEMLDLVARHGVTHMHIVPAMMVRLLGLPDAVKARFDLSTLRHVVHGAAPCPPSIKRAMIDWWGPVIHEYYGSTETGLLTVHDSAEAQARPGTVGRALPGISLAILDRDGARLPPGETGDVYAGAERIGDFTYIGRPEARADIGRDDMVTAGDVGWIDADGYLFLRDRRKDVIASGEVEIYPAEIEAALLALPGVADAAAFGIPDDDLGAVAFACVVPAAGDDLDPDDLRAKVAGTLDAARMPRRIEVMDALPREDSGKVFKSRLREAVNGRCLVPRANGA